MCLRNATCYLGDLLGTAMSPDCQRRHSPARCASAFRPLEETSTSVGSFLHCLISHRTQLSNWHPMLAGAFRCPACPPSHDSTIRCAYCLLLLLLTTPVKYVHRHQMIFWIGQGSEMCGCERSRRRPPARPSWAFATSDPSRI
jgi:hypothetical protein